MASSSNNEKNSGAGSQEEETKPKFRNKLALERSPYLLQHASNPVDW